MIQVFFNTMPLQSSIYGHAQIFTMNDCVLHRIKDVQNFMQIQHQTTHYLLSTKCLISNILESHKNNWDANSQVYKNYSLEIIKFQCLKLMQ